MLRRLRVYASNGAVPIQRPCKHNARERGGRRKLSGFFVRGYPFPFPQRAAIVREAAAAAYENLRKHFQPMGTGER